MSAQCEERAATPEERKRMRRYCRRQGASLRQPLAWLAGWLRDISWLPLGIIFIAAFVALFFIPLFFILWVGTLFTDADEWYALYDILLALYLGATLFYAVFSLWRERRKHRLPLIAADAFPGDHVLEWRVRATAVFHEKNPYGFCQSNPVGDSYFFAVGGDGIFCLEGPEWTEFVEKKIAPEKLGIDGSFPSDDFSVVVMPRCGRRIALQSVGRPLEVVEMEAWETRRTDQTYKAFDKAMQRYRGSDSRCYTPADAKLLPERFNLAPRDDQA